MAGLTGSVGEHGKNARADVALVQFMLAMARDSNGRAYYGTPYTGHFDTATKNAIATFLGVSKGAVIEPSGPAWTKLLAAVPQRYKTARVMAGKGVTVYLTDDRRLAETSAHSIRTNVNLHEEFRSKIARLVLAFYEQFQIVLTVEAKSGGRRTFDQQINLNSDSAPGETVHHYGYAVDLGFNGLRWLNGKGDIATTDDWLRPQPSEPQKLAFWEARNKIADQLKLYSTIKGGGSDFIHLQNYDDYLLDSVSSFMALMEMVGPKKMKWRPENQTPTDYWCDLGLGGDKYSVGTALEIWHSKLRLSKADLVAAVNAKLKKDPKFSLEEYLGLPAAPKKSPDGGADAGGPPKPKNPRDGGADAGAPPSVKDTDITPAHLAAVQRLLRREFEAAEQQWKLWKPVFYTSAARRPSHRK